MNMLSQDLARERIRDLEREAGRRQTIARVRAIRRARRDAQSRAIRLRLLAR